MGIFRKQQESEFEMAGNHMSGLATRSREASDVEVWRADMDAGAATPPHQHDHEEVVVVLEGSGRARIEDQEITYQAGDTLILPAGKVHQIFADTASKTIAAMPIGSTIRSPDGETLELPWRA